MKLVYNKEGKTMGLTQVKMAWMNFIKKIKSIFIAPSKAEELKPYAISIENISDEFKVAVIFGYNDFWFASNSKDINPHTGLVMSGEYGNNSDIIVKMQNEAVPYSRLLVQSSDEPFEIGAWKLTSTKPDTQFAQVMEASYVDANGRSAQDPITFSDYQDPYQVKDNVIAFHYPVHVDGNTFLIIPIIGKSTLTLNIFPKEIFNPTRIQEAVKRINEKVFVFQKWMIFFAIANILLLLLLLLKK